MDARRQHGKAQGAPRARRAALGRAFRLTAPAAVAAIAAAAATGAELSALGVGVGAALGAGLAALLRDKPEPLPPLVRVPTPAPTPESYSRKIGHEVAEFLPLALFVLDARGRVVFANAAATAEFGERLAGRHFSLILRAPALTDAVDQALAARDVSEEGDAEDSAAAGAIEAPFALHGGQERHLAAFVRAVPPAIELPWGGEAGLTPEERRAALLIMIQDVTRARRAEQLHRDFVANASHELKTPLASISGLVETVRGPAKEDVHARERFLTIVAEQADRMIHLVRDLLSLNRIEINEHVAPRDVVELSAVVSAAVKSAGPTSADDAADAGCEIDLPEDLPSVRGDAAELSLMFANLVSNAIKYGGGQSPRIVAEPEPDAEGRIGVAVQDFGPGIAKEHIPRLCERFYRIEDGASGGKSGTGLGLAIVKHVVSRHRGVLTIESRLGQGSRFTVWLPIAGARRVASAGADVAN